MVTLSLSVPKVSEGCPIHTLDRAEVSGTAASWERPPVSSRPITLRVDSARTGGQDYRECG